MEKRSEKIVKHKVQNSHWKKCSLSQVCCVLLWAVGTNNWQNSQHWWSVAISFKLSPPVASVMDLRAGRSGIRFDVLRCQTLLSLTESSENILKLLIKFFGS